MSLMYPEKNKWISKSVQNIKFKFDAKSIHNSITLQQQSHKMHGIFLRNSNFKKFRLVPTISFVLCVLRGASWVNFWMSFKIGGRCGVSTSARLPPSDAKASHTSWHPHTEIHRSLLLLYTYFLCAYHAQQNTEQHTENRLPLKN